MHENTNAPLLYPSLVLGAFIAFLGAYLFWSLTAEVPEQAPLSLPTNATPISVVVNFPEALVVITNTLVPEPSPTATYAMSTRVAPVICGPWVEEGVVCEMGDLPVPTATPLSACPTLQNQECIWTGDARDASPIPYPTPTPYL